MYIYIHMFLYRPARFGSPCKSEPTVDFRDFNLRIFNLRVQFQSSNFNRILENDCRVDLRNFIVCSWAETLAI